MKWVLLALGFFLLPFVMYILSKAVTLGKLQATKEFAEKYFSVRKPNKKEEEHDNGKAQKEE